MSLHKVTLVVDGGWLAVLDRMSGEVLPEETFTHLEVIDLTSSSCRSCGHEMVEGDAIPCDQCGVPLCHWCENNPDIPCTGKEL